MKLHHTVVERVLLLVANYSGHRDETKLKAELLKLDFTTYQQKTGEQQSVLVLTEDLVQKLSAKR
jgi:hypothetical protein